jgi:endonuclease/exonuclease/phosphatase (EEP) superfamily protein YafD
VWNIYKCKKSAFFQEFSDLSEGKDIVLLQEMVLEESFKDYFFMDNRFNYQMAISFRMPFSDVPTGVATGSRAKPFNIIPLKSEVTEPISFTPKTALITQYQIGGAKPQVLTIVNIHAINFVTNNSFTKHLKQVLNQVKLITGPMIFAGDFNTWTDDKEASMYQIMKELNMTEVKFAVDKRITFNGHFLDHIFYRGLKLIESSARSDSYQGSDHHPMVARFETLDL